MKGYQWIWRKFFPLKVILNSDRISKVYTIPQTPQPHPMIGMLPSQPIPEPIHIDKIRYGHCPQCKTKRKSIDLSSRKEILSWREELIEGNWWNIFSIKLECKTCGIQYNKEVNRLEVEADITRRERLTREAKERIAKRKRDEERREHEKEERQRKQRRRDDDDRSSRRSSSPSNFGGGRSGGGGAGGGIRP